ncbi:MAG: HU family DNA-binding protein [archaeon]
MNQKELASAVAQEVDLPKGKILEVIKTTMKNIKEEILSEPITSGEEREVRMPPYGKFVLREVKPQRDRRIGDNVVDIERQYAVDWRPFNASRKK